MIIILLLLFLASLLLSAFFSGSETGLYRIPRLRLVIDSLSGKRLARLLLWMTNNPSLFVATTLVGNNLANYLSGLSIVLLARHVIGHDAALAEILAPIVLSPIVFVYGELLPKNLFYQAPYRLLVGLAPLFSLFTLVFFPVSLLLWGLGYLLELSLGQSPAKARLSLAKRELGRVFKEGQEVGLLQPAQRALAEHLFAVAAKSVGEFGIPLQRLPAIRQGMTAREAIRLARRNRLTAIPVTAAKSRDLIGYVRTIDLYLQTEPTVEKVRALMEIDEQQPHSAALITLQTEKEPLAKLVNPQGEVTGFVLTEDLIEPLLSGDLHRLRR